MKKLLLFSLFVLTVILVHGQYVTPGDGDTYSIDDLVNISQGVVTIEDGVYTIHEDLTIAATDLLEIEEDITILTESGKHITILGGLIVDPPGEVLFSAVDNENHFEGFRFEDATGENAFYNTTVEYAGGIQLIGTDVTFDNCIIRYFDMSNTSAAINLSGSNPVIRHTLFLENAGAAIGSGANTQASPEIMQNDFIRNGTANTNRPQINMGPGGADTLRIVGNYIEGEHTMAGGIGLSNVMAAGSTIALIKDNHIVDNRYGLAAIGNQITALIQHNELIDNDIQGDPMLGGSGLNFIGNTSNQAYVYNNTITGNLWGITIQNDAQPNLGEADSEIPTGYNVIENNSNNDNIYGLYNNTPNPVFAQNNYWGTDNEDEAADYIVDQADDPDLGEVTYLPVWVPDNRIESYILEADDHDHIEEDIAGTIDHGAGTIHLQLPTETDLTNLIPQIQASAFAETDPESGETIDLTEAVDYTVTSFIGEERVYTVTAETTEPGLYTVTFNAMIQLSGFDPDDHQVFITGTMTEWTEPGTDPDVVMEKVSDDPLIYAKTFELEAGTYEYKYFSDLIGEGWDGGEWPGDPNREIDVTEDMTVEDVVDGHQYNTVYFEVVDQPGADITDAVITFDDVTYDPGHYAINYVSEGTYDYLVEKTGYHDEEGAVEVTADVTVEVVLTADDVAIHTQDDNEILLYPNPASDFTGVQADQIDRDSDIRIYGVDGTLLRELEPGSGNTRIYTGDLMQGIYFVEFFVDNQRKTKRLVISR
ncbi:MAG: T9SS type A sorting domain-containing protein [Bacteroidales bacterium]